MSSKKNNNFKRDYRDICYFIDHVRDIDFRISLIRSLGYKIGVNIVKEGFDKEKTITLGKRKEYRIQIAPVLPRSPLVQCAIVER
jgi:hypothetical protein